MSYTFCDNYMVLYIYILSNLLIFCIILQVLQILQNLLSLQFSKNYTSIICITIVNLLGENPVGKIPLGKNSKETK